VTCRPIARERVSVQMDYWKQTRYWTTFPWIRVINIYFLGYETEDVFSTVALRVVECDEDGTHCLGVQLGHHVHGGYKYGDLTLQVGVVSKLRHLNVVIRLAGLGPENDCTGEVRQK
jgi:hypothetical protein